MSKRVVTVAPIPPEKCAYALARYSRSPDSIRESLEWVRTHDSQKFLESFYFQYGHASIADLGHIVMCFEGISELAAAEIEDEQLWDGQARSSRYQNFAREGVIPPMEFDAKQAAAYGQGAGALLHAYKQIHAQMVPFLQERLPRPDEMKPEAYKRNIEARAFDVARYLLPLGIPTGVGQVTSIRTLERQIRRLKASEYAEVRALAQDIADACAAKPDCLWNEAVAEPLAPTLARHVETDVHAQESRRDVAQWAAENLAHAPATTDCVDLLRPADAASEAVATLLYPVTSWPFRALYDLAESWNTDRRNEVIDLALRSRTRRDELLRGFRGGPYVYDLVMDIGAYRDLHRHRRCQQFRQAYTTRLGYDTPPVLDEAKLRDTYNAAMCDALRLSDELPQPGSQYLLPFGVRSRFLFKMDFAEAEYICRVRSGVKGHFSYRNVAWLMKEKMQQLEPELGRLMTATPPWAEDPLKR